MLFPFQRSTFNVQRPSSIAQRPACSPPLENRPNCPGVEALAPLCPPNCVVLLSLHGVTVKSISFTASIRQDFDFESNSLFQQAASPLASSGPRLRARRRQRRRDKPIRGTRHNTSTAKRPISAAARVDESAPPPNAINRQPDNLETCLNKPIWCLFSGRRTGRL